MLKVAILGESCQKWSGNKKMQIFGEKVEKVLV